VRRLVTAVARAPHPFAHVNRPFRNDGRGHQPVIYIFLCYGFEDVAAAGKLSQRPGGPLMTAMQALAVKLLPTTAAVTIRGRNYSTVIDGPALSGTSSSRREDLLSVYIAHAETLEAAIAIGREIAAYQPAATACEIRPVAHIAGGLPAGARLSER
jgi:hypothetical protein